jgi:hypothetical protein
MSIMTVLLSVWGVLTGALIILLIYRGTLTMHEDDQLFLDDSESHMQAEQTELMHRMNRITPMVRLLGAASALLVLVIAGMWIWQGVMQNSL